MTYNHVIKRLEKKLNVQDIIKKKLGTTIKSIKYLQAIDHILLTNELEYKKVWKNTNSFNHIYPSDHYAILAEVKIKDTK